MRYECAIRKRDGKFLVAKPEGWIWGSGETNDPRWEIGMSEDIELGLIDRPVRIHWSRGVVTVMASQISKSLTDERAYEDRKFVDEMVRRKYPVNVKTLKQPMALTAAEVGDS